MIKVILLLLSIVLSAQAWKYDYFAHPSYESYMVIGGYPENNKPNEIRQYYRSFSYYVCKYDHEKKCHYNVGFEKDFSGIWVATNCLNGPSKKPMGCYTKTAPRKVATGSEEPCWEFPIAEMDYCNNLTEQDEIPEMFRQYMK